MSRRDPKPRDSKDRILTAALALFGERGYAVASVDDIAARVIDALDARRDRVGREQRPSRDGQRRRPGRTARAR